MSGLGALYCLVGIISPRKVWYWQEGWKYNNPTTVEPSHARLLAIRVGSSLGLLVSLAFTVGASLVLSGGIRLFG